MKPGACCHCGETNWRTVPDPKTGAPIILWPDPTTRYARVRIHVEPTGEDRVAVGLNFCAECSVEPHTQGILPALATNARARTGVVGEALARVPDATVLEWESAGDRYQGWFTETYGTWLRAWLHDYARLEAPAADAIVAQWEADRATMTRRPLDRLEDPLAVGGKGPHGLPDDGHRPAHP